MAPATTYAQLLDHIRSDGFATPRNPHKLQSVVEGFEACRTVEGFETCQAVAYRTVEGFKARRAIEGFEARRTVESFEL